MKAAVLCIAVIAFGLTTSTFPADAREAPRTDSFQNTFAACNVRYHAQQARRFVLGRGTAPFDSRCVEPEWALVTFRVQTYRYALAKMLLRRDYPAGLPEGVAKVALFSAETWSVREPDVRADQGRLLVADCVIRKEPGKSFALVAVDAGEVSAEPAISQLAATLNECSVGSQIRYPTGFQMHESVVTRMYQLAYAARKPSDA